MLSPVDHNGLGVFVCRHDYHLFLTDHERSLVAFSGEDFIGITKLYSDAGAGGALHYVVADAKITAIDMNGYHFSVTRNGIEPLGWLWMDPIPRGELRKIDTYGSSRYKDEAVTRPRPLDDVYWYKDPTD